MSFEWKGRPVLVTGATGLIGSWLTKELLQRGAEVSAFVFDADPGSELLRSGDFQKIRRIDGDLANEADVLRAIREAQPETVFHLGAQTIVGTAFSDPRRTFESNIRGTYNLLDICRQQSRVVQRILVASSDKAYGTADTLPYDEATPLKGVFPYEVSKSCTDLLAQSYFHTFGLPVAVARCGNVYGGGDLNWSRLIPGTIRSYLQKERPVLRSDGSFIRDYVYVKDIAAAYLRLAEELEKPGVRGEAFNFSPEQPLSVLDVVRAIQKAMNVSLEPKIENSAAGEIKNQALSAAKAHQRLGWKAAYSLEQGLKETIEWYRRWYS